MKNEITWKGTWKWLVLVLAIVVSVNAMADANNNVVGTGNTRITVQIVTSVYDFPTDYDVYTNASNLLDALLGVKLIQGENVSWGFYVTTVSGIRADYENKGQYWEITHYASGEGHLPLENGIGNTPVKNGDIFTFSLESPYSELDESVCEALTIDNLSTRSGPSTKYRETGTYKVKGQYVQLISLAYDGGGVCWVQCEVPYGNKLRRVYTGLKRFDTKTFDLNSVPEECPQDGQVKVLSTSKAMYGPGSGYDTYDSLTVDKGQKVTIIAIENDYAQVEWKTSKQSYRAWVLLSTLEY